MVEVRLTFDNEAMADAFKQAGKLCEKKSAPKHGSLEFVFVDFQAKDIEFRDRIRIK